MENFNEEDMKIRLDVNEDASENSDDLRSDSDSSLDGEGLTQKKIDTKPPWRRGLKKMTKMKAKFIYYGCKRKCGRLKRKYRLEFTCSFG